jgi:hypothetical protein
MVELCSTDGNEDRPCLIYERSNSYVVQGCQMVYFQTKSPNLGKFWRELQLKMLVYFMDIWSILRPFGIFHSHLVKFVLILYTFPRFGIHIVPRKIWQPLM